MENCIEINGIEYIRKDSVKQSEVINTDGLMAVLIRSYASGVHFGYLYDEVDLLSGKQVTLLNSRRVHYWDGACSLSEMALKGVSKPGNCRFAVELPSITITQVIEIIPLNELSFENLKAVDIWES